MTQNTDCYLNNNDMVVGPRGIKKLTEGNRGYLVFSCRDKLLNKRKVLLFHRFLWESKRGKIPQGLFINHKDGNKKNNRIDNLEVVTLQENNRHCREVLGKHYRSPKSFTEMQLLTLLTFKGIWQISDLEKHYNFPKNTVSCKLFQRNTYGKHYNFKCIYPRKHSNRKSLIF